MGEFKYYRDESRKNWGTYDEGNINLQQLRTGAILRIADACERMCEDRERLERQLKYSREASTRNYERALCAERSNAALRGWITRMKNK